MNKWSDYFKIEQVDNPARNPSDLFGDESWYLFEVKDPNGKIVGTYKDFHYAKKQAKYKFKKLSARLEKILLG